MLHFLLATLAVWMAAGWVATIPFAPLSFPRIFNPLVLEVSYAIALVLLRLGHFQRASLAYLAGNWIWATLICSSYGGVHSAGALLYVSLPVSAAWLLGYKASIRTAGGCLLGSLVFAVLEMTHASFPFQRVATPLGTWAIIVQAVLINAIPVGQIIGRLRETLSELQRHQQDLESLVDRRTHELVQARDQAESANAVLGRLIEACPLAIVAFNLDGSVRNGNAAAETLRLAENPEVRRLASRAGSGEPVVNAELACEVDGKTLHLHIWASPIQTQYPHLDGVVMMAADVSERKAFEAHIQQNQRLESIGVLAGGIAHDFNNLLTSVLGNASLLQGFFRPGSREADATGDLIEAGKSMARLTSQMLAYSGRGRFFVAPLDLSTEVRRITNLLQASIPKNVRLNLTLGENMPAIDADSGQLQQVVMNLVINGAEAMGAGQGTVEVRTLVRRARQDELASSVTRPPVPAGEYIVLEVRDTGAGMDEQTQRRIFEPFFTTKFVGRGLGLSAVLGIVRAHHGALLVESRAGVWHHIPRLLPVLGQAIQSSGNGREPSWLGCDACRR